MEHNCVEVGGTLRRKNKPGAFSQSEAVFYIFSRIYQSYLPAVIQGLGEIWEGFSKEIR